MKQVGQKKKEAAVSKLTFPLSMYGDPPTEEMSIEEFETIALDRVQLLKAVDTAYAVTKGRDEDKLRGMIDAAIKEYMPHTSKNYDEDCRKDTISHFILRLAYCRTEELRRWFVTNEVNLFRHRLAKSSPDAEVFTDLLKNANTGCQKVSRDEKSQFSAELEYIASMAAKTRVDLSTENFFKVPFERVLPLVARRKCFLHRGDAFILKGDLITILLGEFRARLQKALATASRALPSIKEDERVMPMLTNMSTRYVGKDYGEVKAGEVTLDQIDTLIERSAPLCMRNMHHHLRKNHHLRHGGRMQFGLFIKGMGLSMEDALTFWRSEFTQHMPSDKFEKGYAYNIRHNYGREGKRTNYTPYNCIKIIQSQPGPEDHHGCPFKHFDASRMRSTLSSIGIPPPKINDVVNLVEGHHYQLACQLYFQFTHPGTTDFDIVVNHPNGYYKTSEQYWEDKNAGLVPGVPAPSPAHGGPAPMEGAPTPTPTAVPTPTPMETAV